MRARAIVFSIVTLIVILTELVCGQLLAARDPIAGVFSSQIVTIAAALGALAARLVLYLLLPGWAIYVAALALVMRFFRAERKS